MSFVICALNTSYTTKQKVLNKLLLDSGIRTLTDGVTGARSNRCTYYLYLSLCMPITFYKIKSNTRPSIKQPQTPELAYESFRTVKSATSNLNDNNMMLVCFVHYIIIMLLNHFKLYCTFRANIRLLKPFNTKSRRTIYS